MMMMIPVVRRNIKIHKKSAVIVAMFKHDLFVLSSLYTTHFILNFAIIVYYFDL